jgi:hypothetical protein
MGWLRGGSRGVEKTMHLIKLIKQYENQIYSRPINVKGLRK